MFLVFLIGASLRKPHTSESFVGSSVYDYKQQKMNTKCYKILCDMIVSKIYHTQSLVCHWQGNWQNFPYLSYKVIGSSASWKHVIKFCWLTIAIWPSKLGFVSQVVKIGWTMTIADCYSSMHYAASIYLVFLFPLQLYLSSIKKLLQNVATSCVCISNKYRDKQVDILVSKNQALQILCLQHHNKSS